MINKSRFFSILMLSLTASLYSFAQQQAGSPSVMIIPFDPNMYFSDADEQLSKYNQKSLKEVRTLFRYGLNINVNAKIMSLYETRPLLTDTAESAVEDLYQIYQGISYFKDKSIPVPESESNKMNDSGEKKKLLAMLKKNDGESEAQRASSLKEPDVRHEYMNVRIHDKRMLPYLKEKYGTELFVFINQFDLVTNYEHCLDRATNTFERDIKVHFSVLDYTGKQWAGDVAIAHFPSNTDDMTEIMRNNFPIIADYLAGKMNTGLKPASETPQKADTQNQE